MKKLVLLLIHCFYGQSVAVTSRMGYEFELYTGSYNDLISMTLNSKDYSPSKKQAAVKKLNEEVEKQIENEAQRIQEDKNKRLAAIIFAQNRLNDILLPGLSNQNIILVVPVQDKPNKERDTKTLQDLWQESLKNEYLLIFIKVAYENFVKQYKTELDFRSMMLANYDNKTLETFINQHGSRYHKELLQELQPLPFWKKRLVRVGVVVAAFTGYIAYKLYRSKQHTQPELKEEIIKTS